MSNFCGAVQFFRRPFLIGQTPTLSLTFHHAHGYWDGFFLQGNGQACE